MNIAKTGAAFGLAALTLASTLSLGAAANAAPASAPKVHSSTKLAADHVLVPFVVKNADGTYYSATDTGNYPKRTPNGTFAEAMKAAIRVQVPKDGTTGKLLTEDGSKCLFASYVTGTSIRQLQAVAANTNFCQVSNSTTASDFIVEQDGALIAPQLPTRRLLSGPGAYDAIKFDAPTSTSSESKLVRQGAEAENIDVYERTASIKGIGEPGATVVLQNKEHLVNKDGEWMAEVTGLKIGDNKFTAKQFDADGVEIEDGDIEFTVTVETTPLSADLVSTSTESGTAEIGGEATPGGVVLLDGKTEIPVDKNGEWSHTLTNLQLGANSVKLAQYVDDAHVSGDQTLDVPLTIRDLTVDHTFGTALTDEVELSGKAEGNAGIVITDADGKETTTKANAAGVWSAPVPAPGAGQQTFTVVQRVHNMDSAPATETVDYGKALAVTSPEDGDKVTEGQDIHFEGTAQRGSKVEITDNGATTPFTSSNPIVTGYWDAYARSVSAGEHEYTVTQTTKGNLKQVDTLTVNKGDSNEVAPVKITNPANVEDGYDANKSFTYRGTAQPNSVITVQNFKGLVLAANVPVNAQGNWEWTYANMKTTTWQLDFISNKGQADEQTAQLRDFKPKPDTATPVKITNPANVADGYEPNKPFTFKGTAKPNSVITVQNFKGLVLGANVPVDAQGNWEWTYANMKTSTWMLDFISNKGQTDEQTAQLRNFAPKQVQTYLTNPANAADGYVANKAFTFKGKARPGAEITVQNFKGLVLATNVPVSTQGEWEWTYPNMKTTIWQLDFIADKGTPIEDAALLRNFGPRP